MARFAHSSESSPIHRGVFLARGVLGQAMRPPPEAVAPLPPDLNPDLTTRERVDLQTRSAACMTCHAVINPLGYTLENFDAVGRFRNVDRGKPVDSSGVYRTHSGETVNINGPRELAEMLARSDDAQGAFTEQLFHHLVRQPAALRPGDARRTELPVNDARCDSTPARALISISIARASIHAGQLASKMEMRSLPCQRDTDVWQGQSVESNRASSS